MNIRYIITDTNNYFLSGSLWDPTFSLPPILSENSFGFTLSFYSEYDDTDILDVEIVDHPNFVEISKKDMCFVLKEIEENHGNVGEFIFKFVVKYETGDVETISKTYIQEYINNGHK